MNKQFWGGVGFPIFVFIGGEGSETCTRLTSKMYLFELAQKHQVRPFSELQYGQHVTIILSYSQALMVDLEHRFYGQSFPLADMSTESLRFLSADQVRTYTNIK